MPLNMRARYAHVKDRDNTREEIISLNVQNLETAGTPYSIRFRCPGPDDVIQMAYDILERRNPLLVEPIRTMALIFTNTASTMAIIEEGNDIERLVKDIFSLDLPQRNINVLGGIFVGNTVIFVESPLDRVDEVREILNRYNPVHIFPSP